MRAAECDGARQRPPPAKAAGDSGKEVQDALRSMTDIACPEGDAPRSH